MPHLMNPFDFIPLPGTGPINIPPEALEGPRLEGYIAYSLQTLTPLNITGKTTRRRRHFEKKYFNENGGSRVIPGASVRGMLSAFIEALTGSDLRAFTRGNEHNQPYGKKYGRHVGFLIASPQHNIEDRDKTVSYSHGGSRKTRMLYERNATLPPHFGTGTVEDTARYLFGYVGEENESGEDARKGRLIFEDIYLPPSAPMTLKPAWDIDDEPIIGGPNPRANTAWYFSPGDSRVRTTDRGFRVWEVLADKVRGRKFYFHQDVDRCYRDYDGWIQNMVPYEVECLDASATVSGGRIYFSDITESLLTLLAYSIGLPEANRKLAHKLGALKPFGFGSVKLKIEDLIYRDMSDPFQPAEARSLAGSPVIFFDPVAYRYLKKIMHFPGSSEIDFFRFRYPPFTANGFKRVEQHLGRRENRQSITPANAQKATMFFGHYQEESSNFQNVMGVKRYAQI